MTGRASVFSNEKVIEWIKRDFVPLAVNVSNLQSQQDRDGRFFRKIAEQGHYAGRTKPTSTRQGLYIATVDGTLLASNNTGSPIEVLRLMHKGINAWNRGAKNSKGKFKSSAEPDENYKVTFPEGGLILRETMRDLPRPRQLHHKTAPHNFDHVWMTAEEVKSFAPAKPEPGLKYEIPEKYVRRLVQFHLIDQVKGESPAWEKSQIINASISALVTQVADEESGTPRIRIKLKGSAKCICPPTGERNPYTNLRITAERGIEVVIRGWLTYDTKTESFTDFDLLACGERWGTATYSFRGRDMERSPIGFAFEQLEVKPENMIRPAFVLQGYFDYGS